MQSFKSLRQAITCLFNNVRFAIKISLQTRQILVYTHDLLNYVVKDLVGTIQRGFHVTPSWEIVTFLVVDTRYPKTSLTFVTFIILEKSRLMFI